MATHDPFAPKFASRVRYAIRSCATAEAEWAVDAIVSVNVIAPGRAAPFSVDIKITSLKHNVAADTYEFFGCDVDTTQTVKGLYSPRGDALGSVTSSER